MAETAATAETPATTTERPNVVKIEDIGPSRKKIAIEVPAETVDEQLGSSLDTLAVEAEIPGFRRGRAPRRLIEKKFGSAVRREAKNQIVASAYSRAVEDHKLRVIGDPVSPTLESVELQQGKPLAFELEVEVAPEFELPSLEGIPVRKPMLEVTDEMVDQEIDKLRLHEGRLEPREAPEPGDYLTGHGRMIGPAPENKVFHDIPDAVVQVPPAEKEGRGMILGIVVDDLASQLGLPKAGDKVTIKATGPENHENEELRGVDLTIEFTVSKVDRIIKATLEELVQQFGFPSEQDLREALRARMNQRVAVEQQSAMRQQVARHLLENTKMDLPERVTAGQAERTLRRQRMELMHRGVSPEQIEENIAELRAASSEVAVRELKLFFIMDRAAEQLDVKVTEGEMNGRIAQMAAANNMRPEKLRHELIQRNQVGQVFQQIREHKAMDLIIAKAAITELSAEEFNRIMQEEAQAQSAGAAKPKPKSKTKAAKAESAEPAQEPEAEPAAEKPKKKTSKKK